MNIEYWLGSESSFKEYAELTAQVAQMRLSGQSVESSELMDVQDGVAVISVHGPLITAGNEITSYFGMTGYNQIREALIEAVGDQDVKSILLDINSPGGSASGIGELSDLISKVNAEYKPVASFSSGTMASAALWIGASAGSLSATRLADVGSIGCIASVMNYKDAMEKEGIKAYIFRSSGAENKALGSPFEEMTDEAKTVIQDKINKLGDEFVNYMASARNTSPVAIKALKGQTYLGYEAKELNLIDAVASVEQAVANLKSMKPSHKRVALSETTEVTDVARTKKILDEKAAALLAAGVSIDTALSAEPETEQDLVPAEEVAEVTEEKQEDASTEKVAVPGEMASFFQAQLAEANEKVINLTLENREMKTKLDTIDVTHTQLRAIAIDAINLRNVGLGRGRIELTTASDEVILSTYSNISKDFNNTFPVGGVTEVASTEKRVVVDDYDESAIRAARI